MKRVLVVEDDKDIAELISIHLRDLECDVRFANDGVTGYEMAKSGTFDLIVLDIMLPGMDGIEICRRLRGDEIFSPILMLTAKSEELDKVLGLEMGADDYLSKPFSVREFIARVKAILRRASQHQFTNGSKSELIKIKNMVIDLTKRKVTVGGARVELTPKEYNLLELLVTNPGKSYSREDLLNLIWGYEFSGYEHTVNSHINRLRSKIEPDFSKPMYILTTWGVGYRFNDEIEK